MATKHTAGPYTLTPRGEIFAENGTNAAGGKGVTIAEVYGDYENGEDAANAALFCAAPDMLTALQGAEEWLQGFASAEPYLAVIRAALSKATA